MSVHIIPISTQHLGVRVFPSGDKVSTWRVTFQIDGGEMRSVISVSIEGSSSADMAVKKALNKLRGFLREAEQVAGFEMDLP